MKNKLKKLILSVLCVLLTACQGLLIGFAVPSEGAAPFEVTAKAAILMDAATGQIMYHKDEHTRHYPASVTKIMPLLLVMEALDSGSIDLTDVVVCSADAAAKGGSQIWLEEGESMTVDELLRAAAIGSANDACCALGEFLAGSEEAFVKMMNDRAAQLNMKETHFDNCTGLDDETDTHLTSAYDIAVMSRELLKHDRISGYTTKWMDSLRGGETQLVNTNKLVRFYEGTTGLKTGTTSKAGYCVSASAMRNGTHLIAVVLCSDNSADRFEDAKRMLNYGFANYETVTPKADMSLVTDVKVIKGVRDSITPELSPIGAVTLPKGYNDKITQEIALATDVEAPVEEGQVLGKLTLTLDGELVGEYELKAAETVDRISFLYMFKQLWASLGDSF